MRFQGKVSLLFVGCMLLTSFPSVVMAKILKWDDVVGKKFCWNGPLGPSTSTYSAGGKTWDSMVGNGTITEMKAEGWHIDTEKGGVDERIEMLPDGTLKDIAIFGGKEYVDTGNYCQ